MVCTYWIFFGISTQKTHFLNISQNDFGLLPFLHYIKKLKKLRIFFVRISTFRWNFSNAFGKIECRFHVRVISKPKDFCKHLKRKELRFGQNNLHYFNYWLCTNDQFFSDRSQGDPKFCTSKVIPNNTYYKMCTYDKCFLGYFISFLQAHEPTNKIGYLVSQIGQ